MHVCQAYLVIRPESSTLLIDQSVQVIPKNDQLCPGTEHCPKLLSLHNFLLESQRFNENVPKPWTCYRWLPGNGSINSRVYITRLSLHVTDLFRLTAESNVNYIMTTFIWGSVYHFFYCQQTFMFVCSCCLLFSVL